MNNLSKIIKASTLTYVLPLGVVVLLFSVAFSVFGEQVRFDDRYIGKIISVDYTQGGFDWAELMRIDTYTDRGLSLGYQPVEIHTGGNAGMPMGLVAAADLAQLQRTRVDVITEHIGGFYVVVGIHHKEGPDDIQSMFGGVSLGQVDNRLYDVYFEELNQTTSLNDNVLTPIHNVDSMAGSISTGASTQSGIIDNIQSKAITNEPMAADTYHNLIEPQTTLIEGLSTTLGGLNATTSLTFDKVGEIRYAAGLANQTIIGETDVIRATLDDQYQLLDQILANVSGH